MVVFYGRCGGGWCERSCYVFFEIKVFVEYFVVLLLVKFCVFDIRYVGYVVFVCGVYFVDFIFDVSEKCVDIIISVNVDVFDVFVFERFGFMCEVFSSFFDGLF